MAGRVPAEDKLFAYSLGQLSDTEADTLTGHVAACSVCCEAIAAAAARSRPAEAGRDAPTWHSGDARGPEVALAAGQRIGRFFLLNRLGAGGMGVVWAAYDPQLDRKVALKFVRADAIGVATSAAGRNILERFAREAKAMAQVSHPNVIAVHDVGTTGEQLYIAEEFIRGSELSHWLAASPRSSRRSSASSSRPRASRRRARRGDHPPRLQARQRVGRRRRPRAGGGLRPRALARGWRRGARAAGSSRPPSGHAALARAHPARCSIRHQLYVPEQYQGTPSDARGDQFSFCVSLHEALYGERPFAATTYYELATKVTQGQAQPIPKGSKVPAWLREVVLRGLRPIGTSGSRRCSS